MPVTSYAAPTARQAEVLEFVWSYVDQYHSAPSFRQVAQHFGFHSPTAVLTHFRALERKGLMRRLEGQRYRGWVPVLHNFCPYCGSKIKPDFHYCPCCGSKLKSDTEESHS